MLAPFTLDPILSSSRRRPQQIDHSCGIPLHPASAGRSFSETLIDFLLSFKTAELREINDLFDPYFCNQAVLPFLPEKIKSTKPSAKPPINMPSPNIILGLVPSSRIITSGERLVYSPRILRSFFPPPSMPY